MNRKLGVFGGLVLTAGFFGSAGGELIAHWKLDEMSGTVARDCVNGFDGELMNGLSFDRNSVTGRIGSALYFDGTDDYVRIPPLNLELYTATITAWVKRSGDQASFAGVFFRQEGDVWAGVGFGMRNELRYHWNAGNFGWDSRLLVPDGKWAFIALVIKPMHGLMYLGEDGMLTSSINFSSHWAEVFRGCSALGQVPNFNNRFFRGAIDDVRIYDAALDESEIYDIYEYPAAAAAQYGLSSPSDAEIAQAPEAVLQRSLERLAEFGDWRTDRTIRDRYADQIPGTLLLIAMAREIKGEAIEQVVNDYQELVREFGNQPQGIAAMAKLAVLDANITEKYKQDFLWKAGCDQTTAGFYGAVVRELTGREDFAGAEKYLREFADKCRTVDGGPKAAEQLAKTLWETKNEKNLSEILGRVFASEPNCVISCALFRGWALELLKNNRPDILAELSSSIMSKFPDTKIGLCASAVSADNEYAKGQIVSALKMFAGKRLDTNLGDAELIDGIDSIIRDYATNSLIPAGIDVGEVYYHQGLEAQAAGKIAAAIHCYRRSAESKGLNRDAPGSDRAFLDRYDKLDCQQKLSFWDGFFAGLKMRQ